MKTIKKLLSIVLVVILCATTMSVAAFASNEPSTADIQINSPRAFDTIKVKQRSAVYYEPPYANGTLDTNYIVLFLSPGDTAYYRGAYTDPHGGQWIYIRVISCAESPHLNTSDGYINAAHVEVIF